MSIYLCISFQSCQTDLVKDNGHKYFLSVLADPYMPVNVFLIILFSSNQTYDRNTQVQCICKFSLIYMYTILVNPLILWGYWVIILLFVDCTGRAQNHGSLCSGHDCQRLQKRAGKSSTHSEKNPVLTTLKN